MQSNSLTFLQASVSFYFTFVGFNSFHIRFLSSFSTFFSSHFSCIHINLFIHFSDSGGHGGAYSILRLKFKNEKRIEEAKKD